MTKVSLSNLATTTNFSSVGAPFPVWGLRNLPWKMFEVWHSYL